MRRTSRALFVSALVLLLPAAATAQPSLSPSAPALRESFDGFEGAGFDPEPTPGRLDSDAWRALGFSDAPMTEFGGTYVTGDFESGISAGGVFTAGVYAFDIGGDIALGVQPTADDFTPGSLQLRVRNELGRTLSSLRIRMDALFLNDGNRSVSIALRVIRVSDGAFVSEPIGVTPELAVSGAAWVSLPLDTEIDLSAMPIADGGELLLSWDVDDAGGSGDRDEVALDDLEVGPAGTCGNAVREVGEACDDGNTSTESQCPYGEGSCTRCAADCGSTLALTGPVCGDGTDDPEEACDDGNTETETACEYGTASCSGCRADCGATLALTGRVCGDGTDDPEEVCDDGNTVTETECAYGAASCTACAADCASTVALSGRVCGDGVDDPEESCDDGNAISETGCEYGTTSCIACAEDCRSTLSLTGSYCGDGVTDAPDEVCDDGNAVTESRCAYGTTSCTACAADCRSSLALTGGTCGDGTTDPEEACDDGNAQTETECPYGTISCLGCDAICQNATRLTGSYCGDGVTDADAGEGCDDGNEDHGDGCTRACQLEPGVDGGPSATDAGDAGTTADSDGGTPRDPSDPGPDPDAGAPGDGGSTEGGCAASGRATSPLAPGAIVVGLSALVLLLRRRRL